MNPTETSPLVTPFVGAQPSQTAQQTMRFFLIFSFAFGLNHATITSTLALASSLVNPSDSGLSSSLLYGFFGATALTFAPELVRTLGPRRTVLIAMLLSCTYSVSYLAATRYADVSVPPARTTATTALVALGGVMAGCATGLLWNSQGVFFTRAAAAYANQHGETTAAATAKLAGYFAGIMLGCEAFTKILTSILLANGTPGGTGTRDVTLMVSLVVLGLAAVPPLALAVSDPPPVAAAAAAERPAAEGAAAKGARPPPPRGGLLGRLSAAATLFVEDPSVLLLAPSNAAFGLTTALTTQTLNKVLVDDTVGATAVGVLGSVTVVVAAALSLPLSNYFPASKTALMVADAIVRTASLLLCLYLDAHAPAPAPAHAAWWSAQLLLLYALFGVNRGLFESVNKAMTADHFGGVAEGAFASIIFFQAVAGVVGFSAFASWSLTASVALCTVVALGAIPATLALDLIKSKPKRADAQTVDGAPAPAVG